MAKESDLLFTERLLLCPLGTKYLLSTHAYASDKENTRYMLRLPNETIEETRSFLLACENEWRKEQPDFYEFAVLRDGAHIGAVSLYLSEGRDEGELGWIFAPKAQGQGYATEAARALIGFAGRLGLRRLVAHCDADNAASRAVMQKLGLTLCGCWGERRNKGAQADSRECMYKLIL